MSSIEDVPSCKDLRKANLGRSDDDVFRVICRYCLVMVNIDEDG
jgi:hypothetical protein